MAAYRDTQGGQSVRSPWLSCAMGMDHPLCTGAV